MKPLRRNSGNQHLHHTSLDAPQRRQAQASRLSRLHPGRHHLPGTASVSPRCSSPARLELFRHQAANNSPRHPALELVVAITLRHTLPEFLLNTPKSSIFTKFVTERQGHQQNAGLPPRRLIPKFLANPRTREGRRLDDRGFPPPPPPPPPPPTPPPPHHTTPHHPPPTPPPQHPRPSTTSTTPPPNPTPSTPRNNHTPPQSNSNNLPPYS